MGSLQADLSAINTEDLMDDAERSRRVAHLRRGGKTAVVTQNTLEFGMSRMREAFGEIEKMPFEFQTFRNFDDTRAWLGI